MARYNEIMSGRFNKFVQKLTGIKGPATMPQVAGELQMVHGFLTGVENRFAEGWDMFANGVDIGSGGVGNFGGARLRNPSGSGVMAVVERIEVMQLTATSLLQMRLGGGTGGTDATVLVGGRSIDPRSGTGSVGKIGAVCIFSEGNTGSFPTPGFFTTYAEIQIGGSGGPGFYRGVETINQEFPLPPGAYIQIAALIDATRILVNVRWRERVIEDSEKF